VSVEGVSINAGPGVITLAVLRQQDMSSLEPVGGTMRTLNPDQVFDVMLDLLKARGKALPPDPSGDDMRQLVAGLRSFVLHMADTMADEDPATASVIRQLKHDLGQALSIRAKVIGYEARPIA
jgi:hypothetical protein